MSNLRQTRAIDFVVLALSLLWLLWLSADYFGKHPLYFLALDRFTYTGFLLQVLLLFGLNAFLLWRARSDPRFRRFFSGLWLLIQALLFILLATQANYQQVLAPAKLDNRPLLPLLRVLAGVAGPLLMLLTAFATGDLLLSRSGLKLRRKDRSVLNIALGVGLWMSLLFLLGAAKILYVYVLLPLALVPLFLGRKNLLAWLKALLYTAQYNFGRKLNYLGALSLLGLVLLVSINLLRIQSPLPTGSDAQNYYINLARLIDSYHGLPVGFQPYNGSLFAALGYPLGNGTPAVLVLSMMGGVLSLYALYRLGRSLLNADPNILLFALLLFYLTPTMVLQSAAELKVDLTLLFMSVSALLLFWYAVRKKSQSAGAQLWLFALLGLFLGWLLGIKLTALFLVFALFAGLWYAHTGLTGLAVVGFLSLGISLLAGMDRIIGMAEAHQGRIYVMAVCFLLGLLAKGWLLWKEREQTLQLVRHSALIFAFAALTFAPWIVKNYVETGSLSPRELLMGKKPGVEMSLQKMENLMKQ